MIKVDPATDAINGFAPFAGVALNDATTFVVVSFDAKFFDSLDADRTEKKKKLTS